MGNRRVEKAARTHRTLLISCRFSIQWDESVPADDAPPEQVEEETSDGTKQDETAMEVDRIKGDEDDRSGSGDESADNEDEDEDEEENSEDDEDETEDGERDI